MTSDVADQRGTRRGPTFFASQSLLARSIPAVGLTLAERVDTVVGITRATLEVATTHHLEIYLEHLLGALKNKTSSELQAGELHENGSVAITSHLAVWLIGKITDAYGHKLINLSKVSNSDSLRSIAGLSALLRNSIQLDLSK